MSYMGDLNFLTRGIGAGAFEGDDALSMLMGIDQARKKKMAARRAAMGEAQSTLLGDLSDTALESAGEGMSRDATERALAALIGFSGTSVAPQTASRLSTGLNALFTPQGASAVAPQSLWETSPLLDADDRRAIAADVAKYQAQQLPVNDIRAKIHSDYRTADPLGYDDVADSLDSLIQKFLGG